MADFGGFFKKLKKGDFKNKGSKSGENEAREAARSKSRVVQKYGKKKRGGKFSQDF